jgi:hypothetical protein
MRVKNGLSCGLAAIHANVESMRIKPFLKDLLHSPDEIESVGVFGVRHFPYRGNVPFWNNESMTSGNGKPVKNCTRQIGFSQ